MSVEVRRDATSVVVVVTGDFDMQNAHEPYESLCAMFDGPITVTEVIVDLAAVDFVDSTGLGGLIRMKQEADRHDAPVHLRGLGHQLRTMFEVTGLNHEFTVEASAPES